MRALATIIVALASVTPAAAQVMYSVLDLGQDVHPRGINASGQSVGFYGTGAGVDTAFRGSAAGQITYLTLGSNGLGLGINSSGQVAGDVTLNGNPVGFLWSADLSTVTILGPAGGTSTATGVNDIGQVAGYVQFPSNSNGHAARTVPGGVFDAASDLGTFGGTTSSARAINALGQVTGQSNLTGNSLAVAFRTTATGTLSTADNLGTLGGSFSQGFSINSSGQVAGFGWTTGNAALHAFRSSPNGQPISLLDLDPLGIFGSTYGQGINSLGVVVGAADFGNGTGGGFVFDTSMHLLSNLVPPGWNIGNAWGINDAGQIAAEGSFEGGPEHGLVLTPVPEPTSLALTAVVGVWFARRQLRRRK